MNRVLKILGVAMVAALAMSVVASSASALEFTAVEYPAEFHGENSAGAEVFTTEAGSVECASTFSGSAEKASSTVEAHPVYSECKAFGFVSATVNTEECNYLFHLSSEVKENVFLASVDVVCPEGQSIKITASTCAAEVGSQNGLEHVNITVDTVTSKETSEGKDNTLTVSATVTGIEYTVTKDGFLCPFNGTGEKEGGEYNTEEGEPLTITSEQDIHIE